MAVKYKYSMESILTFRKHIEDEKKQALGVINTKIRAENLILSKLENDLEDSINIKLEKTDSKIKDEIIFTKHVENSESKIQKQKLLIFELMEQAEEARKELEIAMKNRKMMESLSEKEFNRFIFNLNQKEAKELDDLVTTRHKR